MIDIADLSTQLINACHAMRIAPTLIRLWPDEIAIDIAPAALARVLQIVREHFRATFVDCFGLDQRATQGQFQLHILCALDAEHTWLHLYVKLDGQEPTFPSLVEQLPAMDWYERQLWQELGIRPQGHPLLAGLRLPPDWPEGVYPYRVPFAWTQVVEKGEAQHFTLAPASPGVVDYPLGPVRSGVVESGHYTLRTVGEELIDARLQLFYKHRGIEKRAEGLALPCLLLVAERISGTSAFAHSLALCQAIECIAGVELSPRARFLRTLFAEIERLYNHLGYQADLCQTTGLVVAQAQFDILKERVLRLNAQLSGHRYLFGMNIPGGVSRDVSKEGLWAIEELVRQLRREVEVLRMMLLASPSHQDRLEGTGILQSQDATSYGAVGPIGRASGVKRDLRRDHPYAAYAEVVFDIPILQYGDARARADIRLQETFQSLRIIEQVIDHLPNGVVHEPLPGLKPGCSALGWAESARGECIHWLLIGEDGTALRYHVRPASFANWQAFPLAIPGHNILTDFPVIEQSFGLSFAGADC